MAARSAPLWAALLAAVEFLGESSAAADPAGSTLVSYEAPAGCPSKAQFLEAVRLDGASLEGAPAGGAVQEGLEDGVRRQFRLRIARGEVVTGQLVASHPGGREVSRTIVGARCEDVVRALAVVVSLLADSPAAGNSSAAPSTTEPPDTAAPAPAAPVAAPRPRPASASAPARARAAAAPVPAERSTILDPLPPGWRVGLAGEGSLNSIGSVGLGLAAYLEVIRDVPEGFAPALRLGFEVVQSTATIVQSTATSSGSSIFGTTSSSESAAITRRVARFDACPLRTVAARPWSPSPIEAWACARFDAGVLDVVELNAPNTREVQRTWMDVGGYAHLRFVVSRFFLDIEGGVTFPLMRAQFSAGDPSNVLYRVPVVTGGGGLGLGAYFL